MSALLPDPPKSSWLPFIGLSSALHVGGLVVVPALLGLAWWQSDVSPKGAPLPPLRVGVVLAKDKDAPKPNPNVQEESESNIEPSESLEPWPLTEPNADSTDWTRLEPAFAQSPKPIMATDSPPLIWEWPKEPESENAEPELQAVQKEETKPEPPGEPPSGGLDPDPASRALPRAELSEQGPAPALAGYGACAAQGASGWPCAGGAGARIQWPCDPGRGSQASVGGGGDLPQGLRAFCPAKSDARCAFSCPQSDSLEVTP